jgi:hypothetical protein
MMPPPSITVELPEVGPTGVVRVVAYSGRRLDEHLKGLYQESRRLKGEHLAACVALGHALSVVRDRFRRGAWEPYVAGLGINAKSARRAMDLEAKLGDGSGGLKRERVDAVRRLAEEERAEQGPERGRLCPPSGGCLPEHTPERGRGRPPSGGCSDIGDAGGVTVDAAERLTRGRRWDVMTETWIPAGAGESEKRTAKSEQRSCVTPSLRHSVTVSLGPQLGLFDAVVARGVAALERARAVVASGGLDEARRARIEDAVRVIEEETERRSDGVTQ